jgi:hypothetical protein
VYPRPRPRRPMRKAAPCDLVHPTVQGRGEPLGGVAAQAASGSRPGAVGAEAGLDVAANLRMVASSTPSSSAHWSSGAAIGRPCHPCAVHSSLGRSGHPRTTPACPRPAPFPPSQVAILPNLALGAGGRISQWILAHWPASWLRTLSILPLRRSRYHVIDEELALLVSISRDTPHSINIHIRTTA